MTKQDIHKLLNFFLSTSQRDFDHYLALRKLKRYDAALFFLHLAIEKKIKAVIVKISKSHPPTTHDLIFLAARAGLEPNEEWLSWLRTISSFNIATRYEDEKFEFYKKADAKFVNLWDERARKIIAWIDAKQNDN